MLGLRDVLDAPAAVRNEWTPAHTRRVVDGYARVLVYGTDSVYDTVRLAGLPSELAARAQYCGYVTTPVASDARAARTIRGFESRSPNRPLVLATPGGGEDGKRLLDLFVEAAEGASWDGIAVTGPQLSSKAAGALRRRAASAGVAVRTFVPELPGWFGVVDAVVCMGGYNTLAEALIRGTPTVCVPRTAPRSEQLIRARALAERRLIGVVEPQRASGEALGEEIRRALSQSRTRIARAAAATLDFGGAAVAAETLLAEAAISREAAA